MSDLPNKLRIDVTASTPVSGGYLVVVEPREYHNAIVSQHHNMDLGQVIQHYQDKGYRYVRENDENWLIRDGEWVEIDEVVGSDE